MKGSRRCQVPLTSRSLELLIQRELGWGGGGGGEF